MSHKVLAFLILTPNEVENCNYLYSCFLKRNIELLIVVLEKYDTDLNKLKAEYLYLNSFSLLNVVVEKKVNQKYISDQLLEKLKRLECELYNKSSINLSYFNIQANSFFYMIDKIVQTIHPKYAILTPDCHPTLMIVEEILDNYNIPKIFKWRWIYHNMHILNSKTIFSPIKNQSATTSKKERNYFDYIKKRILNAELKYNNIYENKKNNIQDKYILFLGGKLSDNIACKYSNLFDKIGYGWGRDFEIVQKIENELVRNFNNISLLVRQHPFEKPRMNSDNFLRKNTVLVNEFDLFDLIERAVGVICMQTNVAYISLLLNKKTCMLGTFDLCDNSFLPDIKNISELNSWLQQLIQSSNSKYDIVEEVKIQEVIMSIFANNVLIKDLYEHNDKILKTIFKDSDNSLNSYKFYWLKLKLKLLIKDKYYKARNILNRFRHLGRK